ncbi:MAG: hypothetical protein QW057_06140, partial [Candidatus Bathyarchaeia archaeon]
DKDYAILQVERGLIVSATRDYQPPTLEKVLRYWGLDVRDDLCLSSERAGWGFFIRQTLRRRHSAKTGHVEALNTVSRRNTLQRKKAGRGWLHS